MKRTNGIRLLLVTCTLLTAGGTASAADKPGALRTEIVKAEDAYFALYNKLNADRQYDMICRKERATGTNFATRVCQPAYLLKANQESASERMRAAVSAGDASGTANARGSNIGNPATTAPTVEMAAKDEAFRRNMIEVLQGSPELQELGRKRDELQARLDAVTKGR
jgi:hypothetical protein